MALLALVAGCDVLRDILPDAQPPAAPSAQPAPPPAPTPPAQAAAVPPPPPPAPRERPAPVPDFDPAKLVGLDKDQTLSTLGQPNATREQPPATVWTYKTRDCSIDLFFYMDIATRQFRVLTTEVTTDLKSAEARRSCLNRLRAASRAP
jgi:hypothetical protein